MNFNFSAWSIRHPVPPILLFVILTIIGIVSFKNMAIEQFPNIDVPIIAVSVSEQGATPAELEVQITKLIEDSVAGVSGVKHITSTMSDGISTTAIEFRLEVPTTKALQDSKDAVARIRSTLPAGVDDPVITSVDVENQAIRTYAVTAPGMTLEQLSWFVDDKVKRALQGVNGVGRVERYGGVDREIRINLDPAKLQAFGATAALVNGQVANTNSDSGAGKGNVGGQEQAIRTLGGAKSIDDLKSAKVTLPGGQAVRLDQLGDVTDSSAEQTTFARYQGQGVVAFSVFRAKGASSTDTAKRVEDAIAKITDDAKGAASFSVVDDTVYFIYGNYKAAMEGLIEGALLAVLVVLIFLRNVRATLITAVSLPLSAFPAFGAMYLLGFSLNLVSFLAITLATGILVDDAIVEIENIARHMRSGKTPYRASMEAAAEIGLAVIAITFSVIAIFAPVSFMGGIAGQYFKQFGLTVAVAVFFSLMVARLITPMLAAYLLKQLPHEEHKPGWIMRSYIWLLHFSNWGPTLLSKRLAPKFVGSAWFYSLIAFIPSFILAVVFFVIDTRHTTSFVLQLIVDIDFTILVLSLLAIIALILRASIMFYWEWKWVRANAHLQGLVRKPNPMSYVTVLLSFLILFGATQLFPLLPSGFIPKDDSSRFVLSVELPPGATLEQTRDVTDKMVDLIRPNPEITQVFVLGGASPTGTVETRRASIFVNLRHRDVDFVHNMWNPLASRLHLPQFAWDGRIQPQADVENEILPKLNSIPDLQWAKINPRGAREVEFNMLSTDPVALSDSAQKLAAALRADGRLRAPMAQGALDRPEIQITPKTAEAASLGLTAAQISQAVRVATIGDFGPQLAKFSVDGRQIPIRVQIPEKARASLFEISNLRVINAVTGVAVPLATVADVKIAQGPDTLKRYDRQRQATVGADLPPGIELGDGSKIIEDTAAKLNLPKSVHIQQGADAEIQGEVFSGFLTAGGFGILLMYFILVLLLRNFFVPFSILLSLPLSLGGVVLALLLTRQAFSMPVTIGMLMLIGIVAKNAIMLVDFAVERKKAGMERVDAVIDAGLKRARPIVMTTIAMGAGMFPTALGIGEGGSFRSPMATAVIGGLIVSTGLSLIFVPSFYVVMDDVARLFRWVFARFIGKRDEPKVVDPDVAAVDARVDELEEQLARLTTKPTAKLSQFKPAAE